ncbi:LOW QUALITY PROTEIN: apolipoprotein F-like [Peromyscus leucopus]|uniref:LOW QUALITY PROTEIN: apolipoprotein F-like n=1 Tax=Peromyscus leucopus TaxID=10041 RepID=UPI0010A12A2F|nr:LOW QUALITY PROTEIN: apolipoprotein F-like [Peromyscus leucopus]
MIQAALLLGCVLLSSVAAFPRNTQNGALPLSAITEPEPTSHVISGKIPAPAPGTCQDLLNAAPSLAPLPEYLSLLALRVALEDIGCPTEAHSLQLQLSGVGGKDNTETLILESQKLIKEQGTGDNEAILRGLGGSPGELKRVGRSVTLPETCTSEEGRVLYELGSVFAEFAEKLPSIDVVREFKASAANVTQTCTVESWEHLEQVRIKMMKHPEVRNATLSIEDQIHIIARLTVLLNRIFAGLLLNYFQSYFG